MNLYITNFLMAKKWITNLCPNKMEKKFKREQCKLSRYVLLAKEKGINMFEANNYQRQKRKVVRLNEKTN